uniref:Uncharacterized protein n=1 Tax=Neobodo designis TaxID=312471 RepID=A0A7S1QHA9_NEODS|mmetsp:Transcript_46640/g.143826  ORF Transcript_46640/g.143826 Transcript_46640/m.143826 type:complete len:153 (+) Transcript_46640:2-460(+)
MRAFAVLPLVIIAMALAGFPPVTGRALRHPHDPEYREPKFVPRREPGQSATKSTKPSQDEMERRRRLKHGREIREEQHHKVRHQHAALRHNSARLTAQIRETENAMAATERVAREEKDASRLAQYDDEIATIHARLLELKAERDRLQRAEEL